MPTLIEQVRKLVEREVGKVRVRVGTMITRGVVESINDGTLFQTLKIVGIDPIDSVEHLQQGGISHNAGAGAECAVFRLGGRGSHVVVLSVSKRADRPTGLAANETEVYAGGGASAGRVCCKPDGTVHAGARTADNFVALANLVLTELNAIRAAFDAHTHAVATTGTAAAQTGTAAPTTSPLGPASPVAATKLKAV